MTYVKLDTGFNIEVDFSISSLSRRIVAFSVDLFALGLFNYLVYKLSYAFAAGLLNRHPWITVLIGIPYLFYFPVLEIITQGRTIGKAVMGIRVITLEGGRATISQYLIRWAFLIIDFPLWIFILVFFGGLPWYAGVLIFPGIITALVSKDSQRIGDVLAGTIVIYTRSKSSLQDTVFMEVEEGYKPRYPKVMQMSDKDLNSLKMIIEQIYRNNNHDLAFRIAERIKSKLDIQADQDSRDFLETLLKDYNYYSQN